MTFHAAIRSLQYSIAASLLLCCILLSSAPVRAQSGLPSFDASIRAMRYNAAGNVHYTADDYLQYAPAAVLLGLKAGGYESRTSWGRMAVSDAFSAAIMTIAVNGIKYSAARPRPDGTSSNSFPSGHTATSFMIAAMLHEEYGWRSPWFSFGGYTIASATGISRIINDRHWASDVIAGAVIGIASVKLGYFIADLIFKDKYLNSAWSAPSFGFETGRKYYDIGLYFGYGFILGKPALTCTDATQTASGNGTPGYNGTKCNLLPGGAVSGINVSVPIAANERLKGTAGIAANVGIISYSTDNGMTFNSYDFLAGGYWSRPFAKILEVDTRIMAGYALPGNRSVTSQLGIKGGPAFSTGGGIAVASGENFKFKAFAHYRTSMFTAEGRFVHSVVLGLSSSFFW